MAIQFIYWHCELRNENLLISIQFMTLRVKNHINQHAFCSCWLCNFLCDPLCRKLQKCGFPATPECAPVIAIHVVSPASLGPGAGIPSHTRAVVNPDMTRIQLKVSSSRHQRLRCYWRRKLPPRQISIVNLLLSLREQSFRRQLALQFLPEFRHKLDVPFGQ
jgi:hypothetical protein